MNDWINIKDRLPKSRGIYCLSYSVDFSDGKVELYYFDGIKFISPFTSYYVDSNRHIGIEHELYWAKVELGKDEENND